MNRLQVDVCMKPYRVFKITADWLPDMAAAISWWSSPCLGRVSPKPITARMPTLYPDTCRPPSRPPEIR